MEKLKEYYAGDELASSVWLGKYALKDDKGDVIEETPVDMHWREARELARIDKKMHRKLTAEDNSKLSRFGRELELELSLKTEAELTEFYFQYLQDFKWIIPQGSIMSALGNTYKLQSLSNCFVIPPPFDSYGGIFKTDQEIAQLEKRRGGVGTNLNTLRPDSVLVRNAAGSSTGAHSFMDRYSNTTREVAQNGRRGALMLLMDCRHPDIFKFVSKKQDRTKVTGANISVQLTDHFMKAVKEDKDFVCTFPVDRFDASIENFMSGDGIQYNHLYQFTLNGKTNIQAQAVKIKAKELFDLIVENAWDNAEPGLAFMDRVIDYSPEGVYKEYKPIASNPCGEQWMEAYNSCRLVATNLYSFVVNPYRENAYIDYDKLYEVMYIQQRVADNIVELEIEYIDRILLKLDMDPEPLEVKQTEINLWNNIRKTALTSRRTGCGYTALADMLAAAGLKYDSEAGLKEIEKVMQQKLKAELDATIDMAVTRGCFSGWDNSKEFDMSKAPITQPQNSFYKMLMEEFPDQTARMIEHGRRNVSWSTVAPTGSVSIVAKLTKYPNTSSGMEPQFAVYYFRNKKVNPSDGDVRVDFKDQNGDSWQTYPIMVGGFKEWMDVQLEHLPEEERPRLEDMTQLEVEDWFKLSPYYQACANDISWEKRVEIQSIIQRYTTNAISSTMNLPKDVSKETVAGIYFKAWEAGLKGITIYRDGCRTGVLNTDKAKNEDTFEYRDAIKRPKSLESDLHIVTAQGKKYAVAVGLLEGKPYEVFAFEAPPEVIKAGNLKGEVVKAKKGHYHFVNGQDDHTIKDLQVIASRGSEQMLTRLVSGMLRHGAKPQFIMEQIDKCDLEVISFGSSIKRVLKKYVSEEEFIRRETCKDCGSSNLRMQEGCLTCNNCGSSKCG